MKRYKKFIISLILVLLGFQIVSFIGVKANSSPGSGGGDNNSKNDNPKVGDTKTVEYYLYYDDIYDAIGKLRQVKKEADALETINNIMASCVSLPDKKFASATIGLIYKSLGNYELNKHTSEALNAVTGVTDYKNLMEKYMDLLWQLKPNSKSNVTKRVKVITTYTYKRVKMWGDVFEAWYNTGTKYEIVNK